MSIMKTEGNNMQERLDGAEMTIEALFTVIAQVIAFVDTECQFDTEADDFWVIENANRVLKGRKETLARRAASAGR